MRSSARGDGSFATSGRVLRAAARSHRDIRWSASSPFRPAEGRDTSMDGPAPATWSSDRPLPPGDSRPAALRRASRGDNRRRQAHSRRTQRARSPARLPDSVVGAPSRLCVLSRIRIRERSPLVPIRICTTEYRRVCCRHYTRRESRRGSGASSRCPGCVPNPDNRRGRDGRHKRSTRKYPANSLPNDGRIC